jgi:hypothetical protein
MLSVWGRLAAELLATPAAMVSASYAMNDSFSYVQRNGAAHDPAWLEALDCFAGDMRALSRSYGTPWLGLLELLEHAEPLTIVFVPRELQPAVDTFDERYICVGPVIHAWCAELDDGLTFDRFQYATSVLHCLPACLSGPQSAGTGTVMRLATVRGYAREAGFADLRVLPVEDRFHRLYHLVG